MKADKMTRRMKLRGKARTQRKNMKLMKQLLEAQA